MTTVFLTSDKAHPEDVQPNVIVPYAEINGTAAILDAVKLNLATQGLRPRMVRCDRTYSYDLLFRELWAAGTPFILVEHDVLPWPGALVELWACPEPWCGFPYHVFGELRSYLSCTKFDPTRLGEVPLPADLESWYTMDKIIEQTLMSRGHKGHLHGPPVSHLNFSHSRMPAREAAPPQFWDVEVVELKPQEASCG